tara:strand:+ start:4501 stop:4824 length:324 start_codon:yes stop_codon:yes gene_type:complete
MNLAIVKGIYSDIGSDKFNSLSVAGKDQPHKTMGKRSISKHTLDLVVQIIEKYTNATRTVVINESLLHQSTVNNAVNILKDRGLINKKIDYPDGVRTMIYSMTKTEV